MKTLLKLTLGLMLSTILISACNDKNDDESTQSKIQHVWGIDSITVRSVTATKDTTIKYIGVAADSYDFRADSNLYIKVAGTNQVLPYKVLSSNKILIGGDTTTIQTLTSSKLIGTSRKDENATTYNITTGYLRR